MEDPTFPPRDASISVTHYRVIIRVTIKLEGFLGLPYFHFGYGCRLQYNDCSHEATLERERQAYESNFQFPVDI